LAAYERELINLVQAVRHWRSYLWGAPVPCPDGPLQPEVLARPAPVDRAATSVDQQVVRDRLHSRVLTQAA
jgi:hypothetical protein